MSLQLADPSVEARGGQRSAKLRVYPVWIGMYLHKKDHEKPLSKTEVFCCCHIPSFNPEQVLGVAATTNTYHQKSIIDERTCQDLVISRQCLLVLH